MFYEFTRKAHPVRGKTAKIRTRSISPQVERVHRARVIALVPSSDGFRFRGKIFHLQRYESNFGMFPMIDVEIAATQGWNFESGADMNLAHTTARLNVISVRFRPQSMKHDTLKQGCAAWADDSCCAFAETWQ